MNAESLPILIPVYNEEEFAGELLTRGIQAPLPDGLNRDLSRCALRIFDSFVWLWRKIDNALPWEPASITAPAKRRTS